MLSTKSFLLMLGLGGTLSAGAQNRLDYPIQAVPFTQVKLTDNFWLPRLKTNTDATIPASFARCESTNRVKNFEMAAAKSGKFATVFPFDDTDIYKTIEGASYSLSVYPDAKLSAYLDVLIAKVGAAQEPDDYLYNARTIDPAHPPPLAGPRALGKGARAELRTLQRRPPLRGRGGPLPGHGPEKPAQLGLTQLKIKALIISILLTNQKLLS